MNKAAESIVVNENSVTCYYNNGTGQLQRIRLIERGLLQLERILFPGQQLIFESCSAGSLEVHTLEPVSETLSERIPCERLQCSQA